RGGRGARAPRGHRLLSRGQSLRRNGRHSARLTIGCAGPGDTLSEGTPPHNRQRYPARLARFAVVPRVQRDRLLTGSGPHARLVAAGIVPERPPYSVRQGGSRLCFVRDPDGYRIELLETHGP